MPCDSYLIWIFVRQGITVLSFTIVGYVFLGWNGGGGIFATRCVSSSEKTQLEYDRGICQGFSSSIVYSILLIYQESSSVMKLNQKKRNQTCHICHADVCNVAYSKPYRASCFKQVRHLQNLSVKNSETQEPKYT